MTYFPLKLQVYVPSERIRSIEEVIRRAVEQEGRFALNDLGKLQGLSLEEVSSLLREYVDRTKLMRAREEATFDIRYKDLVVTAEDLRRIAESAFLYAPSIVAYREDENKYLVKEGKAIYWTYEYSFRIGVEIAFYRVDFSTGKPVFVARVLGFGEGSDSSSPFHPPDDAKRSAFAEALDHLHLKLRTEVRKIPEFRLKVNVDRATLNGAYFSLTRKDGLVLGSLLEVKEIGPSGEEVPLGYLIVREVGDGKVETQSYAQIITVKGLKLSGGEIVSEYPQLGLKFTLSPLYQNLSVTAPNEDLMHKGPAWGVRLEGKRAFAEETGVYGLSGSFGVGLLLLDNYLELNPELGGEILYNFRRLFFGLGLRLGYLRAFTSYQGKSAHLNSFGITPVALLSLWITPGFSLDGELGYRLYTPATTLLDSNDDELNLPEGFRYNPSGVRAQVGVSLKF
jgi:hypothetical protein